MNKNKIQELFESYGDNAIQRAHRFNKEINDLIEDKKIALDDFHSFKDLHEAVSSAAFPIITGNLLSRHVIKAYNEMPTVGLELVDRVPSNLAIDKIPGASTDGDVKEVAEGQNYPHNKGIDEKYVQVGYNKYGQILDITKEAIKFDQTGLIIRQAQKLGREAAEFQEKLILNTLQDITNYKAWYPSNSQTGLYANSTTAPHTKDNLITNVLDSYQDIDTANVLLGLMTKENGDPILIMPNVLLVPKALETMAKRLISNTVLPGGANGEINPFANSVKVVSSPYLDTQSSTAWYWGDFKSQFIWKEVMPLEVLTRMDEKNDAAWEKDIEAQYKVRFAGKCAATDFRYVVKSDGSV